VIAISEIKTKINKMYFWLWNADFEAKLREFAEY
jgi:hypothetical protein